MTQWNNLKYELMEEIGENMDIVIFRYWLETGTFQWHIRSHITMDGAGAFSDVLTQIDDVTFDRLPMRSSAKEPGFLQKLYLTLRFWRLTRGAPTPWGITPDFSITGPSDAFNFYYFTEEETETLEAFAKNAGSSLTGLMLKTLDDAAARAFLKEGSTRTWVIPTNMRGAVTEQFNTGNYSTSTLVRTSDDDSEESIYKKMRDFMDKGLLWGSWTFTNLPKYMSADRYRKMVQGMGNAAFGSMSNLGKGPYPGMHYPKDAVDTTTYLWTGVAPSSVVVPINGGFAMWEKRLGLTLKLHPSLKQNAKECTALMQQWIEGLTGRDPALHFDPKRLHGVALKDVYGQATSRHHPREVEEVAAP